MVTTSTETHSRLATPALSQLSPSDKHCVFRCGRSWFSVPAISVREISIAPQLVRVPDCHPSLAGLCHLRSEFVPVISLGALLDIDETTFDPADLSHGQDRLLVINSTSVWSLLIAEAAALESLETVVTPEVRMEDANLGAVMGTAMFRDKIVRVLNPNSLYRLAQLALEDLWGRDPEGLAPRFDHQ